jgi:TPR repeat protein
MSLTAHRAFLCGIIGPICELDRRGILTNSEKALPTTEKCFDVLSASFYEDAIKTSRFLSVVLFLFASAVSVWADKQAASVDSLKERAAQGDAEAQYSLGLMYQNGEGVPQDYVQAYKWFSLAAATYTDKPNHDKAVKERERVAARMTPAQIAEAQRLAREWKKQ